MRVVPNAKLLESQVKQRINWFHTSVKDSSATGKTGVLTVNSNCLKISLPEALGVDVINSDLRVGDKFGGVGSTLSEQHQFINETNQIRCIKATYPKVISPSFLLSANREILYETIESGIKPALARDSTGVAVCCSERVWLAVISDTLSRTMILDLYTHGLSEAHQAVEWSLVRGEIYAF